ncbi:amidase [Bacillus sp. FJAT-27264]|uniref:amidase n=1 Tax=Paenibacillus sp. (strain DSM 101736 / FJAT-27264) TaxID=1850362 RepID=UPI000807B4CF|nr:amidase [Bacillus sp. FJAT-27264]OBZ19013.1 amidase [Bacillus sp. FJAT-27264]
MQPEYNAFVKEDLVVEPSGSGILSGLQFAAKDVFSVAGHRNTAGNPDWLRTHEAADRHAEAIERTLQNGAKLGGMTQTDELMFSLNGENTHYGTPVNPRAPGRIPGGSSSGSAVAVAAGVCDFALGTDTGGSVRIPSAYCGIYGIRPTHGRVSLSGVIPLADSFDTVGWMGRSADVLHRVGQALLGVDEPVAKGFERMILPNEAWSITEPSCRQTVASDLPLLQSRLASSEFEIAPEGLQAWVDTFRTIQGYEIWQNHGEWITREKPNFGPGIAERFAWTSTLLREEFDRCIALRAVIRSRMTKLLGEDGLLVIPTAPCAAPVAGLHGEEVERTRARVMQLSCIAGLCGFPQVTVPYIDGEGWPVGLSFIAGPGRDLALLRWVEEQVPQSSH